MSYKKDIIIIGGGISGLTCARELSQHTDIFNITLLEASNRIGGRAFTHIADDGTILELGAHYIHGTKENVIYDYAVEKGIVVPDQQKESQPNQVLHCFLDGILKDCSHDELKKAIHIGLSHKDEIFKNCNENDKIQLINKYPSIGHYTKEHFDKKLMDYSSDAIMQKALKSVFISEVNEEISMHGCKSLYDLDVKGYFDYIDLEGDLQYIMHKNGYTEIINAISNEIQTDCVKLNHKVEEISLSRSAAVINDMQNNQHKNDSEHSSGLADRSKQIQERLKVKCRNGKVFQADVVVFTCSVEVLKAMLNSQKVNIPMPIDKNDSINRLCLGKVVKVYFKFKIPINPKYRLIRFFPAVKNYDKEIYERYDQIVSFDRILNSDWWLIWVLGDLIDEFHNNEPVIFMEKLFNHYRHIFPDFPKSDFDPKSLTYHDWTLDEHYGGSYSYLKVGASSLDIIKLAEPVSCGEALLLFAGEMTDPRFYSTAHGAYMSGIREANRVKKLFCI